MYSSSPPLIKPCRPNNDWCGIVCACPRAYHVQVTRVTTRVYITDINDNRPVIVSPPTATVFETAPTGYALWNVVARDADSMQNARLSYHILMGNEAGYFSMNDTTGVWTRAHTHMHMCQVPSHLHVVLNATQRVNFNWTLLSRTAAHRRCRQHNRCA
jgi:hypothetical protein